MNKGNKRIRTDIDISNVMWDRILNDETVLYMQGLTEIHEEYAGVGEESEIIKRFFSHLKDSTDYKSVVMMAMSWKTFDDLKQAKLAISCVGQYHASRFIVLMDYLAERFIKGEL